MASTPPFGLILPSRPVLVEPQVISQTQYAFSFPTVPRFSHIVVFLLPSFTMPEGTLAGVYIKFPTSLEFALLGAIGMEKQSAIFKVRDGQFDSNASIEDAMTDAGNASPGAVTVGIPIEPAGALNEQLQSIKSQGSATASTGSAVSTKGLAQRIIKNAFNFLASYAGSAGPGGVEVVPLKSFQDWWTKFERKVENDPGFLERDDSQ